MRALHRAVALIIVLAAFGAIAMAGQRRAMERALVNAELRAQRGQARELMLAELVRVHAAGYTAVPAGYARDTVLTTAGRYRVRVLVDSVAPAQKRIQVLLYGTGAEALERHESMLIAEGQ